jgi:hypothetical protein
LKGLPQAEMAAKRTSGENPPEGSIRARSPGDRSSRFAEPGWSPSRFVTANCIAWKGHEIVAVFVLQREHCRCVGRHKSTIVLRLLFFVRVNQVLVRLWARAMEAGLCLVFVPLSG